MLIPQTEFDLHGDVRSLTAYINPNGRYYHLSYDRFCDHKYGSPAEVGEYKGAGNGFIVIDKDSDVVVRMSYASDGKTICNTANLEMSNEASVILWETDEQICVRANFSNVSACLF